MKKCKVCGAEKPHSEFSRHASTRDRLQTWCKGCRAEWLRQDRLAHPERWKQYNQRNKDRHAERYRREKRAAYAADPAKHIERSRRSTIRRKYGLTLEKYEAILAHGCAICGADGPRMALDHDHATGQLRDALCSNCNNGLGRFADDPARLRVAADYLEKHS